MNQRKREIYFHVGLPKTASTFLQKRVFPRLKGIKYLKKHEFDRYRRLLSRSAADKILLSFEFHPHPENPGSERRIKEIQEDFPVVYPIIVLRKHGAWLRSKYKYFLRKHGSLTLEAYTDPKHPRGAKIRRNLYFFPLLDQLERAFGHPPLVLLHQELREHPQQSIGLLAQFMNVDVEMEKIDFSPVKTAYTERQLKWVRQFNRAFPYHKDAAQPKYLKKPHQKWHQLLLHSTALAGRFLPELNPETPLYHESRIQYVDSLYEADWKKCLEYARRQRQQMGIEEPG